MGTTVLVASMRDDGQTFHESRTPERSSEVSVKMQKVLTYHLAPRHLQS
jgi:hypothetical protein